MLTDVHSMVDDGEMMVIRMGTSEKFAPSSHQDKGIVKKVDAGKEIGEVWTDVLSKLASK